jgi:membrane protein implicated in regulation of membrane protease activity
MIEWLAENAWVTWVGVGVLLAVAELLSLDLVLLMFGLGALAAAVASAAGAPFWAALIVFAAVSVSLLSFARPPIVARLHAGPTLTTGHDALVGRTAVVLEPVGPHGGRITLASEVWSARTDEDGPALGPGLEVVVTRIDGATAVITPKETGA